MFTPTQNQIRIKACNFYKQINKIRCPALNYQFVHFSSEGFKHLIYKGKGKRKERSKQDQIARFKLLPRARELVKITTTFQEYDESVTTIKKKRFKKVVQESATIRYWGLIAIIRNVKIKVIIREVGNGKKHFWSVIPAWRTSYERDIKILSMSKGDMEND